MGTIADTSKVFGGHCSCLGANNRAMPYGTLHEQKTINHS